MDKRQVTDLVLAKSERISYGENKGTSTVWKSFRLINVDKVLVDFVKCITCSTLLKWKSRDGTSGLSAHLRSCTPETKHQMTMSAFSKKSEVPASVKSHMADVIVRMCATDIR